MTNKPTPPKTPPAPKPRTIEELDLQFKTDMADIARMHKAAMARLDKESAERKTAHEKTMARLDKESAERKTAHKEEMARLDKKIADSKVRLKAVEQEVGSLSDGTVLEEDIFHALLESRTICGIRLDNVLYDMKAGGDGQFDVVGFNGKYVVVIEVKRTLKIKDAYRFAEEQKPVFEREFAGLIGKKKVLGAMVYRRASPKARTAVLENGLLLVHSVGKKKLHQTFE